MVVTIHYTNRHGSPDRRSFPFEQRGAALEFINAQEPIKMRSDEYLPRHRVHLYTTSTYWTENDGT